VQMDKLPEFNARRQRTKQALDEALAPHADKVVAPRTTEGADTTWMRYPFMLNEGIDRTAAQEFFLERNIATRMVWTGNILRQPGFANIEHRQPADGLPNCDAVMDRALTLPAHHGLTSDDVGHLVDSVSTWLGSL
jgi:CDP-6-deoxy-D-xylo-4-hexulose-3-dehydrase